MLHRLSAAALAALLLPACLTSPESDLDNEGFVDGKDDDAFAPPLSTLAEIFPEGRRVEVATGPVSKASRRKFDLVAMQTPVKDQSGRGVCSIFASAALVEHLYKKAGIPDLDISEQYLQWSTKENFRTFRRTEGSNNEINLSAVNRFGVPTESAWAYETSPWTTANDSACNGQSSQPYRCYTNGAPPAEALAGSAFKIKVGTAEYIGVTPDAIRNHIDRQQTAVAIGIRFFYQAWNHRRSNLVINNDRLRQGVVTMPNQADIDDGQGDREAGHAVLIVGWDDDFTVQKVDEDGNLIVDANGAPVVEKGFYIFKNSWGTGRFGVENPYGQGYGYISYEYVQRFADAMIVPRLPTIQAERCDLATGDEDLDGLANCDDSACATAAVCATQPEPGDVLTFSATPNASIPDNNTAGTSSTITIAEPGTIASLRLALDITHPYVGDLKVTLKNGTTSVVVHDNSDGSADNIVKTVNLAQFNGQLVAGTWTLEVVDSARADVGTVNSWSLTVATR